jgi:dihydrofolate reductase
MRKLKIIEHISLYGVIQAPGAPKEDGDYPYGGWAFPFRDPDAVMAILAAHGERFDLLLGRRTYDIWAGHWPNTKGGSLANSSSGMRSSSAGAQNAQDRLMFNLW